MNADEPSLTSCDPAEIDEAHLPFNAANLHTQQRVTPMLCRLLLLYTLLTCLCIQTAQAADTMQLWVTVDWEGLSLEEDNLQAMRQFRQKFPHIPMVQLINPAYFVQKGAHRAQMAHAIRSTFLEHDTIGLHLHPLMPLVQYCGVPYQSKPTLADEPNPCEGDRCGYSVSLEYGYNEAELTQLVACSSALLVSNGFNRPRHFRAGGWQLGPKLQAALEANHFVWDSSRIASELLTTQWSADSRMVQIVQRLHPDSTPLDQPYALSYQLMEFPDNAALADYTSTKQLLQLFKQLVSAHKPVMVLGFHQETAADYLPRLERAIPHLENIARQQQVTIEWMH